MLSNVSVRKKERTGDQEINLSSLKYKKLRDAYRQSKMDGTLRAVPDPEDQDVTDYYFPVDGKIFHARVTFLDRLFDARLAAERQEEERSSTAPQAATSTFTPSASKAATDC